MQFNASVWDEGILSRSVVRITTLFFRIPAINLRDSATLWSGSVLRYQIVIGPTTTALDDEVAVSTVKVMMWQAASGRAYLERKRVSHWPESVSL